MSHSSKVSLTENGVLALFGQDTKTTINMQVVFLVCSDVTCYLRLSDGKHVTPIIFLLKKEFNPPFAVGAVIAINEVYFDLHENRTQEYHQLEDQGIYPLIIKSFALLETHSSVGQILGSLDYSASYRDAIKHVHLILRNLDPKFDTFVRWDIKKFKQLTLDAERMRERGNNLFRKMNYDQAIIHYDMAKKKDPFDYRVWYNCSQAHFKREEYDAAEENALISIKLNPFIEKVYCRAGRAALRQAKNTIAEIYAQTGIFICGSSKDLQQILDEVSVNPDNFEGKTTQIIAVNKGTTTTATFDEKFMTVIKIPSQDTLKAFPEILYSHKRKEDFGLSCDEEQMKEQKRENKERRTNIRDIIKFGLKEDLKEKEEKKIREEKRREKEEERKRLEARKEEKNLKPKNSFRETLQDGRRFFEMDMFRPATEMFKRSLGLCSTDGDGTTTKGRLNNHIDLPVIQFLEGMCKILSGRGYILDGMKIMKSLSLDSSTFSNKRAAHIWLGLGYEEICLYKKAYDHACEALQSPLLELKWPGTDDPIKETIPETLSVQCQELKDRMMGMQYPPEDEAMHVWVSLPIEKSFVQRLDNIPEFYDKHKFAEEIFNLYICGSSRDISSSLARLPDKTKVDAEELLGRIASMRPTPKAKCRYRNCISTQGHSYAKEEIYITDPDFKGFLDVTCEESCTISYHPCCWKAYKELQEESIGRMSDKDFLGLDCMTPDCTGKICCIRIYDETGRLKNELVKDKKEKKHLLTPVKQKKKKEKKKEKSQAARSAEVREKKKNKSESLNEDIPSTDEAPTKTEVNADQIKINKITESCNRIASVQVASTLPIDPESLETTQVTILKPTSGEEQLVQTKSTKKNKKKNKKKKATVDLLVDPLESAQTVQNEYVARLRVLRQQREAYEADLNTIPKATSPVSSSFISDQHLPKWLDPENPFYLTQHLRDNPEELETLLQTRMMSSSSQDLQPESVDTLLDFMYDWLKLEGPVSINDARLRQQVSENFHEEACKYVNQCGGIKEFLMQSIKFAMIDDVICVGDHVVQAQEMICKDVMNRMTTSRYLVKYTDGQKAKKFTHLLDDSKSTCSPSSSTSQLAGSGVSYASRGTSDSPISSTKLSNGEMNNNKAVSKTSQEISPGAFEDHNTLQTHNVNLSIDAPEFKPCSNEQFDEEEENVWPAELDYSAIECWAILAGEKSNKKIEISLDCEEEKDSADSTFISGDVLVITDETNEFCQSEEEIEASEDLGEIQSLMHMKEVADLQEKLHQIEEQNQLLNDKLCQARSHSKSEINKLKQQLEEFKEMIRELEIEKQSVLSQRENDSRKFKSEMSRMQEEVKTLQSRNHSLELKSECSNDQFNELQAKLAEEQEVTMQLREEMKNLQESLTSSSRRAHEAEVKYMCTKKDLVEDHLNCTIERLSDEVTRLRQLFPSASEETIPDRTTLTRSIVAWDETIKSLRDHKRAFMEEGSRLLGMVNQGRPLNALPPGDLTIPLVPDISIVPLLCLGQKSTSNLSPLNISDLSQEQARCLNLSSPQPPPPNSCVDQQSSGVSKMYPSGLDGNTIFIHNGATSAPSNSGAIPKGTFNNPPNSSIEVPSPAKWPDSHQLYVGQLPWEYTEGDIKNLFSRLFGEVVSANLCDRGCTQDGKPIPKYGFVIFRNADDCAKALSAGPIIVGNHSITVQGKENKKAAKPTSLTVGSLSGAIGDPSVGSSSLAYGLSDISLNASAEVNKPAGNTLSTPTLHQPAALSVTKPKFQNLTSNNTVGAIGTLPPKLVRPQPRQAAVSSKMGNQVSAAKEDCVASTTSYKRLIEACKQRIGKDYASPDICAALREVRTQNNNSLSGISTEKIVERVKLQLRSRRPVSGQASVAPWAGLTQGSGASASGPEWHGPSNEEGTKVEETCSICLEVLNASPTVPLQCQHVFHEKCIKDWLRRQSNCPNCRTFALMTDEYPSLTHT